MSVYLFLKPLGAGDYLEISRQFDTVIIRNVPHLWVGMKDQARRLTTLIDNFYDQKVTCHKTRHADPDFLKAHVSLKHVHLQN